MADELNVGLLLYIPYRAMETRIYNELAAAGYQVSIAQARIFQRIGPTGSRLTELAEAAQVTKQTAGYLVDQLEKAGFVERVPDPTDARARLVRITARGAETYPITSAILARIEAEWTAHVGRRAMDDLKATLTRLREITDPYR